MIHNLEIKARAAVLDKVQARQRSYFRLDVLSRIKELKVPLLHTSAKCYR